MEERRSGDRRIDQVQQDVTHLHECVEALKSQMAENTVITKQVRDILASFQIIGAIAKWVAAIGAGATAVYHGVDWLRKH